MGSEEEAKKAVEDLKGFEFDGRAMNVECVTPQPEKDSSTSSKTSRGGARRGGRGGARRGGNRSSAPRSDVISKTVIYIGNLPYSATEDDLKNIFAGYNISSARVVRRPTGVSKGYGFVTVASEADQTRALAELLNVECDDRHLHTKAAHSEEPYEERKKEEVPVVDA